MSKQFTHNPNSGSLFKNKTKNHDRSPDYTGQINVDGTLYWISGWIKKSANGNSFMSLATNVVDETAKAASNATPNDFSDDDVPF